MKCQILIVFIFLCFCIQAIANDFLQTIPLSNNECAGSVTVTKSGAILSAGIDFSANDALLMKLDSTGSVLKAQRLSGSGEDDAQAVIATSDGGAVVVGSTTSFGAGNEDGFILKIRASGSIAWRRTFGTSGNERFVRIVQTSDKGFIVLGDIDHGPLENDVLVAKFNSRGGLVWIKTVSGTPGFDHASSLALTSDDGAIVSIASDLSNGVRSILAKFSVNGSIQWTRMYGSADNHLALSAFEASDGTYYFTEILTRTGSQTSSTVLSKLNASGIPLWSRIYKSRGANLSTAATSLGPDGSILLSGNISASNGNNSRGILIGVDENGRVLWHKRVNPDGRPVFIGQPFISPTDGSILIAGCAGERSTNDMDLLLLKTQKSGKIQGGCSKLTNFALSSGRFHLTSSDFTLEEIPVPYLRGSARFNVASFSAAESSVCFGN